jgi:hypothetical protein
MKSYKNNAVGLPVSALVEAGMTTRHLFFRLCESGGVCAGGMIGA